MKTCLFNLICNLMYVCMYVALYLLEYHIVSLGILANLSDLYIKIYILWGKKGTKAVTGSVPLQTLNIKVLKYTLYTIT